jgi:hypothetical protein
MSVDVIESQALGPVISEQTKLFRYDLNIVESPSVGTLVAPADACELVGFALMTMLQVSKNCRIDDNWTRVRCTVDLRRKLHLEVIDNGRVRNIGDKLELAVIGKNPACNTYGAKLDDPTAHPEGGTFVRLTLQLPN